MERSRPDQILESWRSAAASAIPPAAAPRRSSVRSSLPGLSLAGAGLLVAALLVAVVWIGRPGNDTGVGAIPTLDPSPTATADPSATPDLTKPSAPPQASPTIAPKAVFGSCELADFDAAITMWEGAAGSRIATVELTHTGSDGCWIPLTSGLRLIDATGTILIDGSGVDDLPLMLNADDHVTSLVRTSNYCGDPPATPVTIEFVGEAGTHLVATPLSPTDDTVPPCSGDGSNSVIEMQPWTR